MQSWKSTFDLKPIFGIDEVLPPPGHASFLLTIPLQLRGSVVGGSGFVMPTFAKRTSLQPLVE